MLDTVWELGQKSYVVRLTEDELFHFLQENEEERSVVGSQYGRATLDRVDEMAGGEISDEEFAIVSTISRLHRGELARKITELLSLITRLLLKDGADGNVRHVSTQVKGHVTEWVSPHRSVLARSSRLSTVQDNGPLWFGILAIRAKILALFF